MKWRGQITEMDMGTGAVLSFVFVNTLHVIIMQIIVLVCGPHIIYIRYRIENAKEMKTQEKHFTHPCKNP